MDLRCAKGSAFDRNGFPATHGGSVVLMESMEIALSCLAPRASSFFGNVTRVVRACLVPCPSPAPGGPLSAGQIPRAPLAGRPYVPPPLPLECQPFEQPRPSRVPLELCKCNETSAILHGLCSEPQPVHVFNKQSTIQKIFTVRYA